MRLSPLSQVRSAITGKNRFPVTIRQIQVSLLLHFFSEPSHFLTFVRRRGAERVLKCSGDRAIAPLTCVDVQHLNRLQSTGRKTS